MIALLAAAFLSVGHAKHAIRVDAKLDNPTHVWVDHCRRLSPVRVRCRLTEEIIEAPNGPDGIETITALGGNVTVTRERRGLLRVHRDG